MDIEQNSEIQRKLQLYNVIESNCEMLTFIRKPLYAEEFESLPSLSQYVADKKQMRLNYENFAQLLIEIGYMVYSCKYYGLTPQMNQQDVRIQQNHESKKFTIVMYYRISEGQMSEGTYLSFANDIFQYIVFKYYESYRQDVQPISQAEIEYISALKVFMHEYSFFTELIKMLPLSNEQEKCYFLGLEQTTLFRDYSMLLKIQKNSIVHFVSENLEEFKKFKTKDVELVSAYNNAKKKTKIDENQLKAKEGQIEKNIKQFLEFFAQNVNGKITDDLEADQSFRLKKRIYFESANKETDFGVRLSKIDPRFGTINYQKVENNEMGLPPPKIYPSEYLIEYSSDKNSICVRCMLHSVSLSLESTDYVLIQSNVMNFDTANISIEVAEVKQEKLPPPNCKKIIAFRGASCFNNKEPPLEKILLLMDMTLIAAKIYELELYLPKTHYSLNSSEKLINISRKVQHYTKMLLKSTKKVYHE